MERLRELHLAYYRSVRALVAASEPVEVAALVNVQLITFDDASAPIDEPPSGTAT